MTPIRPVGAEKHCKYTPQQLQAAVKAVEGGSAQKVAARNYGVPPSTIQAHLKEPSLAERKIGRPTGLLNHEERKKFLFLKRKFCF